MLTAATTVLAVLVGGVLTYFVQARLDEGRSKRERERDFAAAERERERESNRTPQDAFRPAGAFG